MDSLIVVDHYCYRYFQSRSENSNFFKRRRIRWTVFLTSVILPYGCLLRDQIVLIEKIFNVISDLKEKMVYLLTIISMVNCYR